jgi:hypothetical protein
MTSRRCDVHRCRLSPVGRRDLAAAMGARTGTLACWLFYLCAPVYRSRLAPPPVAAQEALALRLTPPPGWHPPLLLVLVLQCITSSYYWLGAWDRRVGLCGCKRRITARVRRHPVPVCRLGGSSAWCRDPAMGAAVIVAG